MKNPHLCPESEEILSVYYRMQRQADSRHSARTTIRLLESLVRLAQVWTFVSHVWGVRVR